MINVRIKRWIAGVVLGALASVAAAESFDRFVVFGTSLSDPGNAFAVLGTHTTPPDWSVDPFLVPDRPYARGGHHFSNGATWIEQLARPLGLAASAQPALRSATKGATNYAFGGARAYAAGGPFDLPAQVERFLQDAGGTAPASALYVVEMGGNDLRDALVAYLSGGLPAAGAVISDAVESIAGNIVRLHLAGASDFLVWTVPDIGLTPAVGAVPGGAFLAGQLTLAFNAALDQALGQVQSTFPILHVTRLDVYAKQNMIVSAPQVFGLRDVTTACITPNVPPFTCRVPDTYLFWDGIHPTAAGHAIIAQEARMVLAP